MKESLGADATYLRKGVGNVNPQLNEGNSIHLHNLFYVPNRKKNLVSISEMEVKGFRVAFIDGKVRVKKYNFQRCFFSWVQGWQFVSSCKMVH